ncbi:MAG: macrolide ABC transporter ATP-binding protein [Candidatus Colwellbacteria bacterium CG10_big_fil_rev_8_21_14_0_10_42_22]|uniref:Macrolide ABC transporter ATP-binding protein n=1 Tax=Candidatus Colwellbacteria bacterium CG10_big_fil_rev_8_21_14_0_10_42_22 TaxID=1974540 RepID=A0A2H0VFJ0_9BACT|nr:MAG: macrolide ABC transporter ATP-binding protein [Candidatus Colwellbacteria bacterium CG10_big_fil_rev_8_21_14_0_10_42_22]
MDKLIEAKNLSRVYATEGVETVALKDVSLDINKGEFVAIMGPSGSGKSTLLHILALLDKPTSGSYLFDGKSIDEYSEDEMAKVRNEKAGFVFQAFNLLPRTTVLENVELPLLYSDKKESDWEELAMRAIKIVNLEHRIKHESAQLSGGEKQRVAIARAMVNEPEILFADEPTGNLDTKAGNELMEIISKLNQEGRTIILITHEEEIAAFANRIIKLRDGLLESDVKKGK